MVLVNTAINAFINVDETYNKLPPQLPTTSSQYLWDHQVVQTFAPSYDLSSQPGSLYWNPLSDRRIPHEPSNASIADGAYHISSTRHTITRLRPGATNPGGRGVDVKHGWYGRYYNRMKAPFVAPVLCACNNLGNEFVQGDPTAPPPTATTSSSFKKSQQRKLYSDMAYLKPTFYSDTTSAINSSSQRLRALKRSAVTNCAVCKTPNPRFMTRENDECSGAYYYGFNASAAAAVSSGCRKCNAGMVFADTYLQSMK